MLSKINLDDLFNDVIEGKELNEKDFLWPSLFIFSLKNISQSVKKLNFMYTV